MFNTLVFQGTSNVLPHFWCPELLQQPLCEGMVLAHLTHEWSLKAEVQGAEVNKECLSAARTGTVPVISSNRDDDLLQNNALLLNDIMSNSTTSWHSYVITKHLLIIH